MAGKMSDGYDYRLPWNPTKEQMQEYEKREIELARLNILINGHSRNTTLHSAYTISKLNALL